MTMYLSNKDVRATGYEPAEFIVMPASADEIVADARALSELATRPSRGRSAVEDAPAAVPRLGAPGLAQ